MSPVPLPVLRQQIVACTRCPRLRAYCERVAREKKRAHRDETYWGRPVPGFGDPAARLLIVGLAPAAHGANRTGRMFTGDSSGDFLMAALHRAGFATIPTSRLAGDGLRLTDAFVAAAARCAPPDNKPLPAELDACYPWLRQEAAALPHLRVVVALGRIAFQTCRRLLHDAALSPAGRPSFGHGARCEFSAAGAQRSPLRPRSGGPERDRGAEQGFGPAQELTLIASYHPSRQNTNTRRLTPAMLDEVFSAVRAALGRGATPA